MTLGGTINFTGQKLDDTGLLFYNARYYDPGLGRFVSPDNIVPEAPNSKLTVDFHEQGPLASMQVENAQTLGKGFGFQTSGNNRLDPSGPSNPQALGRYVYALNNPVLRADPTGHLPAPPKGWRPPKVKSGLIVTQKEAKTVLPELRKLLAILKDAQKSGGLSGSDKELKKVLDDLGGIGESAGKLPGALIDVVTELLMPYDTGLTGEKIEFLVWFVEWLEWLGSNPDSNAWVEFYLNEGGSCMLCVRANAHATHLKGQPDRDLPVGETIYYMLQHGGIGSQPWPVRIPEVPNR